MQLKAYMPDVWIEIEFRVVRSNLLDVAQIRKNRSIHLTLNNEIGRIWHEMGQIWVSWHFLRNVTLFEKSATSKTSGLWSLWTKMSIRNSNISDSWITFYKANLPINTPLYSAHFVCLCSIVHIPLNQCNLLYLEVYHWSDAKWVRITFFES